MGIVVRVLVLLIRSTSPIASLQLFACECSDLKQHKEKIVAYLYIDQFVKVVYGALVLLRKIKKKKFELLCFHHAYLVQGTVLFTYQVP